MTRENSPEKHFGRDGGHPTDEAAGTHSPLSPRSRRRGLGRTLPGGGAGRQRREDPGCLRARPGGFFDLAGAPTRQHWLVPTSGHDPQRSQDLLRRQERREGATEQSGTRGGGAGAARCCPPAALRADLAGAHEGGALRLCGLVDRAGRAAQQPGQGYHHPAHGGPKIGWILAGHKRETYRELDLLNEARRPLSDYLASGQRRGESAYVFTSQRAKKQVPQGDEDGWRLTEDGIHQWFQEVRLQASVEEAALIDDITFHDLRHDFGHRLRGQDLALEEVAYYLGHVNADGTPSIQTTVRYTQVGREQVKARLRQIRNIEGGE